MNPIKAKRHYLKQENAKYGPVLVEIPRKEWSAEARQAKAQPERIWRSRHFFVHFWTDPSPDCAGRLSINRTEIKSDGQWKEDVTWEEMQALKEQAGFGDTWAVKFFPPDASIVNVANMRHLWLMNKQPTFGWHLEENLSGVTPQPAGPPEPEPTS